MDLNKIGTLISTLRKEKKLTQSKLGEMLGVGDKAVSKWERGINAPDISLLNSLSSILGITVTELLNGEKNEKELNSETIKFYTDLTRKKILKKFLLLLLMIIIIFLSIFMINNYNRFQVYSIHSEKEDFVINGYMIFNREKNILIVSKIEYIDKYIGTDKEILVKKLDIFLKNKNFIIQSKTIEGENGEFFSLSNLLKETYIQIDEVFLPKEKILVNSPTEISIEIQYLDMDDNNHVILIPLNMHKEISNNKLFYR